MAVGAAAGIRVAFADGLGPGSGAGVDAFGDGDPMGEALAAELAPPVAGAAGDLHLGIALLALSAGVYQGEAHGDALAGVGGIGGACVTG
jgi:hypothetical protein